MTRWLIVLLALAPLPALAQLPEMVRFPSGHDAVDLVGYLFLPAPHFARPVPAVVLMHGRAGAYSSLAKGEYTAMTLTRRHRQWGELWAEAGFAALLVDGFGPRGYPTGFERNTYKDRPAVLDETEARPRDAYAALALLRTRPDIAADRIGLMGWSNGGSTTLAALADNAPGRDTAGAGGGFRIGAALYPGCGLKDKYRNGLKPYAPLSIFIGSDDDETPAPTCARLVERSNGIGAQIGLTIYPGAEHSYDSDTSSRNANPANLAAMRDTKARVVAAFRQALLP